MSVHFKKEGERIIVFGQTFPHKEEIKRLGGRFNGVDKNWHLPNTPANQVGIQVLCEMAGGGELASSASPTLKDKSPTESGDSGISHNEDMLPPWDTDGAPSGAKTSAKKMLSPVSGLKMTPKTEASATTASTDKDAAGLTVSQLMGQVHQVVTRGFPAPIWVVGEIQSFSSRSNTFHFNLADAKEGAAEVATIAVKATAWPSALSYMRDRHGADKLRELFADGIKIRCLCRVTLYKDRGQISLSIEDVDPAFTKGELALARETLLRELRAKGLDGKNKALTLPAFPFRIGLVSAEGSRAESDFLHQLESGGFPGTILFVSAKMQGDKVPKEVSAAIKHLNSQDVDAIVITRGGGSAADLRWFDSIDIAYAIANSSVPIIAAIGHHDDVCIAEEICFMRQKTPTAAAQFLLDWFAGTRDRITNLADRIIDSVSRRLEFLSENLQHMSLALVEQSHNGLNRANHTLVSLANDLHRNGDLSLQKMREVLFQLDKSLTSADPTPWLAKGWTQLTRGSAPVLSVKDADVGDEISARLIDGILTMQVTSATKKGSANDGKKSN